jgi:hypothetical protein
LTGAVAPYARLFCLQQIGQNRKRCRLLV